MTLSGTAGATDATVTGSGTTYNVAVSGMPSDGTVIASIPAGGASDAAGNTNLGSVSLDNTVTFDTVAPAPTIDPEGDTNDNTPNLSGTAGNEDGTSATASADNPSLTLRIWAGTDTSGAAIRTLTVTRTGGSWNMDVTPFLADGTYTAKISQGDAAGNTGTSAPMTFKVDTVAPAPTIDPEGDTNDNTPNLSGTAGNEDGTSATASADNPSLTLRIWAGTDTSGAAIRTLTVTRTGGSWNMDVTPFLADGTYTAKISQGDAAGNTGTSAPMTFKVDTVAPAPTIDPEGDTNDNTPNLSGTAGNEDGTSATASADNPSLTLRIWAGTDTSGAAIRTLTVTRTGGSWNMDVTPFLADGTYTAKISQGDAAGNTGTSAPMTFKVDTVAPAPTIDPEGDTNDNTPNLSGTAGNEDGTSATASADNPSLTLRIWAGTDTSGAAIRTLTVTRTGGSWNMDVTPFLADGTYTAKISQGDAAGNTGTSAPMTFKVDTVAPAPTIDPEGDTNDNTPNLSGTAGNEDGTSATASADNPSLTLRIWAGTDTSGAAIRTLTVTRTGGSWNMDVTPFLADGTYTAKISQGDAAGNTGTSAPMTFKVDTVDPAPTIDPEGDTNDNTPNLSGTAGNEDGTSATASADNPSLTLRIWAGTDTSGAAIRTLTVTRTGGSWNMDVTPFLADGTYTAKISQGDAAGNTGTSAPMTFKVDTTPPDVAITFPAHGGA